MSPLTIVLVALIGLVFLAAGAMAVWATIKRGGNLGADPELGDVSSLD